MRRLSLAGFVLALGRLVLAAPGEAQRLAPALGGIAVNPAASGVIAESALIASRAAFPSADGRSAARIIAVHTAVGTGAGLLIGLLLSGASVGDDQATVVLTWTALGAAAGVVSGVVNWLMGREQ